MIPPTIGRKVWYRPSQEDLGASGMTQHNPDQAFDATVVYVWNDNCVNLSILDHAGEDWRRTCVAINNTEGASAWAEWMPYQIGQAKKHEEETK